MRKYAQLNIAIWNDDDFRALTPQAQHLYFLLLSHPTLSYCGVGDWRPARIARMANGWDAEDVERAGAELVDRLFVVIDFDTEEFLVRTFVKNDPLMRQRNLGVSMARAYSTVASDGIRGVVVSELRRLESDSPELKSFGADEVRAVLEKPAIDPSVYPCGKGSFKGSVKGSINPCGEGSIEGSINPKISEFNPSVKGSIGGSVEGSVQGSPTPAPSPTTVTTGGFSGASLEGVKGGLGGKGKPNTANGEYGDDTEMAGVTLDDLAGATRRAREAGISDTAIAAGTRRFNERPGPKGPGLLRTLINDEWEAEQIKTRIEADRRDKRTAITNCDRCDENGMRDTGNGLTRCKHPLEAPQTGQQDKNDHTPTHTTPTPQNGTGGPY